MAKQSWHRFASARDFGDTLNKALRNEPIEFFDPERTRPRLQRATKALEEGDFQFAGEILGELEAEGHMDDCHRLAAPPARWRGPAQDAFSVARCRAGAL